MREMLLRGLLTIATVAVQYLCSALLGASVRIGLEWIRDRIWPPVEDPERRRQQAAWAAFKAGIEERTLETHVRDPHVLRLPRVPTIGDAAPLTPRTG